eukprot:Mycagemm_TRINITY_DN1268_c0_g1::TRINITY_DN1268_c0_g1_i1::g.82::m.82 type:complete len:161 gc:universal TRINITY_DN1268_c0_g1_i1:658-176(-)
MAESNFVSQYTFYIVHCFGIVNRHFCTCFEQYIDIFKSRSFTDIIRIRFECKTPNSDCFSFQAAVKISINHRKQFFLLIIIHIHDRLKNAEIVVVVFGSFSQSLYVFWKTASTVSDTGKKESFTNAAIRSDTTTDIVHVCTYFFTKVSDFIHESDFHRQE